MKTMSAVKGALIAGVAMGTMPMAAWAQSAAAAEEEAAPAEEMVVVGQRQPKLPIGSLQRRAAAAQHVDLRHACGGQRLE